VDLLERVRTVCVEAYAHQVLPFEHLVEEVQPGRDPRYTPLVQVLFELHNTPATVLELPGLEVSQLEVGERTAAFDLTVALHETAHGLTCDIEYSIDLFDASTIQDLLHHYRRVLEAIVADPSWSLAELPNHRPHISDGESVELDELFA
jgi:non-ribosomal peptide synthetase component F